VTGAGPGAGPHVKVFDGATGALLASFFAFDASFQGGVRVALGDFTGDGRPDLVTAAGPGAGPHVKVFDGATGALLASFFAFDPAFQGGVFVAAGDVNGDGRADLVTGAGAGAGPHVKVFGGADGGLLASFFAFAPGFSGGVRVAVVDVTGDGVGDLVTAPGPGTPGLLRVFSASVGGEAGSGPVFDGFTGGVFVGGQ
jgi:hypothetical protein